MDSDSNNKPPPKRVVVVRSPRRPPHPLDRILERHRHLSPGGYTWIPNLASVEGGAFDLTPGVTLRVADKEEIEELRHLLNYFQARVDLRNPWETIARATTDPATGLTQVQYCHSKPRYTVLSYRFPPLNSDYWVLTASLLARGPVLLRGYRAHTSYWHPEGGGGIPCAVGGSRTIDRILEQHFDDDFMSDFTADDAEDLSCIFGKFEQHRLAGMSKELERGSDALRSLLDIDKKELRLLGCFTVIESLVTHKPEPADPYQSLIRQVSKKLNLLNARFLRPIQYSDYIQPGPSLEKIWKTMYELRSQIAHGVRPEFKTGKLTILKSADNAQKLAFETARSLLRQTLEEPQLMKDLRDC